MGDRVEIIESQPLSKLKRWKLVRVLEKSTEVDLAALRAARKGGEKESLEVARTEKEKKESVKAEAPAEPEAAADPEAQAEDKTEE